MPVSDDKDRLARRCPRLGGAVTFGYCRRCDADDTPCGKVFDCWWERFDVVEHMRRLMPAEDFRRLMAREPRAKLTDLIAMIEAARSAPGEK